ncbi:MAG: TldD/PmbA family protein [Candidatus Sericytochromatia bacterium]|nr:TldD/PmbA family protein [Candidatus Tanganyikabacteria bacterium]
MPATLTDVQTLLAEALAASPAEATEFVYTETKEDLTRFGANAITQNVMKHSRSVGVRVQQGGREARVETAQVTPAGIARAISEALEVARFQQPDPALLPMLAEKQAYREVAWPKVTPETGPEGRAEGVARAVEACKREGARASGICSDLVTRTIVANSHGILADGIYREAEFSLTAEREGGSGWAKAVASTYEEVDLDRVVAHALEKCLKSEHPRDLPVGDYPVALHSAAVADLATMFMWLAFSGLAYQEGRHFAVGKLGEKFFDDKLGIADDPFEVPGLPFDYEGVAKDRTPLIEGGRLVGLAHDRHTARKAGVRPTGHGLPWPNTWGPIAQNLSIAPGDTPIEDVLRGLQRGLLITHLHYLNVVDQMDLSITGLTRDGVFWVEDGQIKYPVKNMRFTDSLLSLFGQIDAVSRERERSAAFWEGATLSPAMRLPKMHFSSPAGF